MFFPVCAQRFSSKERGLGRSTHLRPSNAASLIKCLNTGKIKSQTINLQFCTAVCSLTAALIWQQQNTCDILSYRQTNKRFGGLRFIVVWIISTNRPVKKLFDSVLYTNIVKCSGVTEWLFDDKNVRSVLVKLTVADRDKFCFDIKQ